MSVFIWVFFFLKNFTAKRDCKGQSDDEGHDDNDDDDDNNNDDDESNNADDDNNNDNGACYDYYDVIWATDHTGDVCWHLS